MTTRNNSLAFAACANSLEIQSFTPDDGASFVQSLTSDVQIRQDGNICKDLAVTLGGLPLAITQMVALLRAKSMTISEFIAFYSKQSVRLHGHARPGFAFHYSFDLSTVWKLGFESLSPNAAVLLGILSFYDPDSVCMSVLEAGCGTSESLFSSDGLAFLADELQYVNVS